MQLRHFDRGQRGFFALVAVAAAGAHFRVLDASTASTPFSTGMPKSSDTRISPSAQRSATCS